MFKKDKLFNISFLAIMTVLFMTKPTYAYLDPGTGSFVIQVLVGFVAGAGVLVKMYWNKIISIFRLKIKSFSFTISLFPR